MFVRKSYSSFSVSGLLVEYILSYPTAAYSKYCTVWRLLYCACAVLRGQLLLYLRPYGDPHVSFDNRGHSLLNRTSTVTLTRCHNVIQIVLQFVSAPLTFEN